MNLTLRVWLVIPLIGLLMAACSAGIPAEGEAPSNSQLRIEGAWARMVPLPNGNSALYFTVVNPLDQPDHLLFVRTDAGIAEPHESVVENGVSKMLPRPGGFSVPARGTLTLDQGGKHIMVMGVPEPLEPGAVISATLTFANAGVVQMTIPVQAEPTE